jgi:enamine deaminase RidA (YjgF/YER057c/UK114 family)
MRAQSPLLSLVLATVLVMATVAAIHPNNLGTTTTITNNGGDDGDHHHNHHHPHKFCCDINRAELIAANSRLAFITPVQVQLTCAGDTCFSSAVDAVKPDTIPYAQGDPFPDTLGGQMQLVLQQTVAAFAEAGNKGGRKDVAFWHIQTPPEVPILGNITASIQSYYNFTHAYGGEPPALAWTQHPIEGLFSPFTSQADAKALYRVGYEGCGCLPEFKAYNSPRVPRSPYFSHAVIAGRTIHTSLLTSSNIAGSVAQQTTVALGYLRDVLRAAGQDTGSLIEVVVYLRSLADKSEMDAAYKAFFGSPAGGMPIRTVFGNTVFPLPGQNGARVGVRAIALRQYEHCSHEENTVELYNVPEVFHEPTSLSNAAAVAAGWVYYGGIFSSNASTVPSQVPSPIPFSGWQGQMYDLLQNILVVGSERGVSLPDFAWTWVWSSQGGLSYYGVANATAQIYNNTQVIPCATTFEPGGEIPYNFAYQSDGQFWYGKNGGKNYAVAPSSYPWIESGDLLNDFYGLPPGTIPNALYCTNSSLRTCAKPGWLFDNYPWQPRAVLGPQQTSPTSTPLF